MQVPNQSYSVLRETNNECSSLPSLIAQAICRASTGAAERGTRSMPANGDDRNAGVRRAGQEVFRIASRAGPGWADPAGLPTNRLRRAFLGRCDLVQ